MEREIHIISPMPPSVNHYTATKCIIKNGRPLSIVYKTKESVAYQTAFKKTVSEAVIDQQWVTDLTNPRHFYVDADFYMDKKHKDCSNLWKCLLDAITETQLIWQDDDIVCERVNKIVYDAENPRVELYIHYVDYIGIFDNEAQLDMFKTNNCIGCKRYKRNCTLLKNALDGRVQPEIDGTICAKKRSVSTTKQSQSKTESEIQN